MAVLGIGTDIVSIRRIEALINKYGNRFLKRVFTVQEQEYCRSKARSGQHFAGRFAAKEAIAKALYQSGYLDVIPLSHIEVSNDRYGRPVVAVSNLYDRRIKLSISHDQEYAIAMAVVEEDD
jgi:holo-[acyl-carrier protein] synthase